MYNAPTLEQQLSIDTNFQPTLVFAEQYLEVDG